jgi:hypothetical protein
MAHEYSLKSPIVDYLYEPFLEQLFTRNRLERSRLRTNLPSGSHLAIAIDLAKSFETKTQMRFESTSIIRHKPQLTSSLVNLAPDGSLLTPAASQINLSLHDTAQLAKEFDFWVGETSYGAGDVVPEISTTLPTSFDDVNTRLYVTAMAWQTLVESSPNNKSRSHPGHWAQTDTGYVCSELCIVTSVVPWVVLSFDVLLMIKDIAFGNWLTSSYSRIDPGHPHLYSDLVFVQNWGFDVIKQFGNMGYEIVKGIEPLTTCRLIELSETLLDPYEQSATMIAKYKAKEDSCLERTVEKGGPSQETKTYLTDTFISFLRSLDDPNRLSQVFSMMRMCGHPYVDAIGGCEAKKAMSQSKSTATYTGIKNVEWSFCHMFVAGYIAKNKHWPPITFRLKNGVPTRLQTLHEADHQPLPMGLTIYNPSDWDFATFLPIDDFDYGEDLLSLVSDKSLSYKRSEIANSWSGHLKFRPKRPTSSKRVVQEALASDMTVRDVCLMVEGDCIPDDWYVVTVHPKEREMKLLSRLFCMMVFWMRCFFNNLEENIAHKIFPYIPHQTMTMNAKEEEETFLRITSQSKDHHMLAISIDLSAWNTHFTKEMSDPLGERFNQLLGVKNLFTFIHTFYQRCLFVLRHPCFEPHGISKEGDPPWQPGIWGEDGRGNEGIGQKFWTSYTLAMLHWVIWRFGVKYTITCQGDNLVLYIPTSQRVDETFFEYQQRVRRLSKDIVTAIESAATEVGHEVKAEECSQSTSFCTYGKNMWFRGAKLESTFKVVSRMFPHPDSDLPTVHSMIGTLSAQGSSMTDRARNSLWCYFFTKFLENWMIRKEFRSSILHGIPKEWELLRSVSKAQNNGLFLLMTLIPSNLGGFPVSCLAEFLYRGHSDPLSSSLGSLAPFLRHPLVNRYISFLGSDYAHRRGEDLQYDRIIENPFDIPLKTPPVPGSSLVQASFEEAMKLTANKGFKEIFSLATKMRSEKKNIFTTLVAMRPFYPTIAHEIFKCSAAGAASSIAKSIYSTKTICTLVGEHDKSIVKRLSREDIRWFRQTGEFMLGSYSVGSKPLIPTRDLYPILTDLRSRWGIEDLTGVSNCHPLMGFEVSIVGTLDGDLTARQWADGDDCIITALCLEGTSDKAQTHRGRVQPYLGNYTEEKAVAKWAKPVNTSKPLKDVIRLLQIAKMISEPGSETRLFIESIAQQRSNLPLLLLYEFARDKYGGTTGHRFSITDAVRGSFLSTISTWASNISISTNLLREVGLLDYPISIHEYVLTLITMSNWYLSSASIKAPFGIVYRIEPRGLPEVKDVVVELKSKDRVQIPVVFAAHSQYYLRADTLMLSNTARPINKIQGSIELTEVEPSVTEALFQTYLSAATGPGNLIPCGALVRSQPVMTSLVDLPEVFKITMTEHLEALALSVLSSISMSCILAAHRGKNFRELISEKALQASLIVCPQAYGTFKKCTNDFEPLLSSTIGTSAVKNSTVSLSLCVHEQIGLLLSDPSKIIVPVIFEKGVTVLSSDLANRLSMLCIRLCLSTEMSIPSAKVIVKICLKLKRMPLEMDRVLGIVELIKTCCLQTAICRSDSAPQLVLRMLRVKGDLAQDKKERHVCQYLVRSLLGCCQGTGKELTLEQADHRISPYNLITSWSLRPFPGISDANHRWSPLSSFLTPGDAILVVGIGSGGILQCIPTDCTVDGLDLPSTFLACGQDYTTFQPAFFHPNYKTLPASWLRKFNIEDKYDRTDLSLMVSGYDVVVIDVEGVSTKARLLLRQEIASQGPKCWVKCYDSPKNISEIHRSACSLRMLEDRTWSPSISMGAEIILGSSASPLGLFKALGSCFSEETTPCEDYSHDGSRRLSRKMCLFQVGANPDLSNEELRELLCNADKVSRKSLIVELFDFQAGDQGVLARLGRQQLRCVEYLSRYI